MATLRVFEATDMSAAGEFDGYVTVNTETHIRLSFAGGSYIDNYYGHGFSYHGESITGGTVTGMDSYAFGRKVTEVDGLSHSAVRVAEYLMSGDSTGLYAYGFSGDDTFIGSSGRDVLFAFDGNDVLIGMEGNDTLDGGAGIDTAVYGGARSSYTIDVTTFGHIVTEQVGAYTSEQDTLVSIERLKFLDGNVALDLDGSAGQAYRIYQAAFDRKPDAQGLGFWIHEMDKGLSLEGAASRFLASEEFRLLYGEDPGTDDYVAALYRNILHREADQSGRDFWVNEIESGRKTEARVLAEFSESTENQAAVIADIRDGIQYAEWVE